MFANAIPAEEFAARRQALLERMEPGSIALLPAAPERQRNRDVHHPYRQDSDFYYLTGFPEPEALAVLIPGADQPYVLFCRERDPEQETWNGRRAGQGGAVEHYGADVSHPITALDETLPTLLENRRRVYCALGYDPDFDNRLLGWVNAVRAKVRTGVRSPRELVCVEELIHDLRLRKNAPELAVMRQAAEISAEAHRRAMQICKPGLTEYQIEAEILHVFARQGAGFAYPSIVGGGENGCILHYTENSAELRDGDLLLIDAGAEMDNYAADITRTFPVNGRFSPEQRAVYDVVLAAQKAAIATVMPGHTWNQPHEAAVRVLTEGLVDLGLLQGELEELIDAEAYKPFYMHRTGHWLGMDVHDVGDYKIDGHWRQLEPGMVLTVEPGLYIAAGADGVDPRWWSMGIRIEDDVLVTPEGCQVLTSGAPKDIETIEALMRG